MVAQYGWDVVRAYMKHVMDNAEESVRRVIARISDGTFRYTMDDGAPLCVRITVDRAKRSAVVDFTGTGPQRPNNFNSPPAVTRAAVLYVFRCLVGTDIPLNDGCLMPIELIIPPGTFLVARTGRRRRRGQYRSVAGDVQRAVRRPRRARVQPGDDEQLPVRRRDAAILRDHLRRHRRGRRVRRRIRGANAHDEHANDRSGGAGTAISRDARGILDPPRLRRRGPQSRRRRRGPPHPLPRSDDRR